MGRALKVVSGEFLLDKWPNGGEIVLLRSLLVSSLICLFVLPLKAYLSKETLLVFSLEQLKEDLGQMIPWFGAVFAGTYAAFYTRFSSQWTYLASLYNQMMEVCVTASEETRSSPAFVNWQAAFIEDALDLHLARKPMFALAIAQMLEDPKIVKAFCASTKDGAQKIRGLESALKISAAWPAEPADRPEAPMPKASA